MNDTAPPKTPDTSPQNATAPPALGFDWQDWLPFLDDPETPMEQKQALIEVLWSIVLGFADLGFEVKAPHDQAAETCGHSIDLKAALEAAVLHSEHAKADTAEQTMPQQHDQPWEDAR